MSNRHWYKRFEIGIGDQNTVYKQKCFNTAPKSQHSVVKWIYGTPKFIVEECCKAQGSGDREEF